MAPLKIADESFRIVGRHSEKVRPPTLLNKHPCPTQPAAAAKGDCIPRMGAKLETTKALDDMDVADVVPTESIYQENPEGAKF